MQGFIEKRRLKWFGHVKKMITDCLSRRALKMKIRNTMRSLRRPRIKWLD